MKRNDRLIRLVIGFAAALTAVVFAAFIVKPAEVKAEGHADHCICGGTDSCLAAAANNGHQALKPTDGWKEVTTETELRAAVTSVTINKDVFIYLGNDISLTDKHISTASRKVHLCLNGHTLTAPTTTRVFAVYKSSDTNNYPGTLTITDCSAGKTGKITALDTATGPGGQGGLIYCSQSGTLELYAGTIENGRTSGPNPGGNVSIRGGASFRMYGGTIQGGTAGTSDQPYGGNVEVQGSASFTMYSGKISGGYANHGGNVSVYDTGSSFTMKSGTIESGKESGYNSATYGGNVLVLGAATFTMDGGTITGGRSGSYGGNVAVSASTGTFTMNAGTISDGKGGTIAGNVYVQGKFNMKGGRIENGSSGNKTGTTSSNQGHNIYVDTSGSVTIEGNSLITNTIPADNGKYDIFVTKTLVIKGSPILNVTTSGDTYRSIYMSGENARLTIDGGSFIGNVYVSKGAQGTINGGTFAKNVYAGTESSLTGHIEINSGYFGGTVAPTSDSPGTVTINGGYFKNKPAATADNENVTYNPDLWTINDDPRIPFTCRGSFTKADGTTGHLQMNYTVTSYKQITGRNMTLNENLSLGIYVNADLAEALYKNEDGEGKLTVELNGVKKEANLTELTEIGTNVYAFSYDGVTPELMGDEITVKLYASNGTTVLDEKTYTIKEYLTELQNKTAAELGISDAKKSALDTLVTDLLVYGREAQKKFNHNTDALVISESETGSGRTPDGNIADIWNKTKVTRDNYQDAEAVPGYFKEATVIHENVNWIRVKFNDNAADGQTTFTVQRADGEETPITLTEGYLVTDGLKPTEYGTRFIYRAYRGTEEISKVEYSMNSYCVRKHGDTGHEFSDALFNYGASALAYASAS